jgi:hypothetical protein
VSLVKRKGGLLVKLPVALMVLSTLAISSWASGGRTCRLLVGASLTDPLYCQAPVSLECHLCDLAAAHRHSAQSPPPIERPFLAATSSWLAQAGINLWPQEQGQPSGQKKQKQDSPSGTAHSPGHIFWVIPAFKVDYGKGFQPLTPREKFQEWARGAYDPAGLGWGALEAATLEYSSKDGFCGYGHGWGNYGKCYGSLELDAIDSGFIGDFALAALLHQDPRYFRLGQATFRQRVEYAVSRVFVTYNDSGHTVFFTSALSGTAIAAALSNLYYPAKDVNASHTMTRIGIDLGNTALYNLAAEFWPDIHRKLHHIF